MSYLYIMKFKGQYILQSLKDKGMEIKLNSDNIVKILEGIVSKSSNIINIRNIKIYFFFT